MATEMSPDVTRDVTPDTNNMSHDVTPDADEMPLPGETNKEAAARLGVSVRQVQRRRERMRQTSDIPHDARNVTPDVTRDIESVTSDVTPATNFVTSDTENDRVTALQVQVAELKTTLKGKDELIEEIKARMQGKEELIVELRDTKRILEERINRTEVLLQQAQKAFPVADTSHDVTPDTENSGMPLWLLMAVVVLLAAAGFGGWEWLTR